MKLAELQREQAHDGVRDRLRAYILENGLRPGDPLPSENEIAAQLKVSRPAVREAFRSLEAAGMIETRRGVGRRVKSFEFRTIADALSHSLKVDVASVKELLSVREALESGFLPLAIENLPPEAHVRLGSIVADMHAAIGDRKRYVSADMEFHKTLFSGVDNRVLQELLTIFWHLFMGIDGTGVLPPGDDATTVALHAELVDVVGRRDFARAKEVMHLHFKDVRRRLADAT